jgi:hypothetical protein
VTEEFNPSEPGSYQLKYYASGVGNVRVGWRGEKEQEKETLELVELQHLSPEAMAKVRREAWKWIGAPTSAVRCTATRPRQSTRLESERSLVVESGRSVAARPFFLHRGGELVCYPDSSDPHRVLIQFLDCSYKAQVKVY